MSHQTKFKQTEIGMIPEDWKQYKLHELCNFETGKLNSNAAVKNGKYPFFTCSPKILSIDKFSYNQEAILLSGNNAEGIFNVKYYKGKFDAYQRTYIIEIKNNNILDYKFLYYLLIIYLNYLRELSIGTATKFLTLKILNKIEIKIPPLEEQKQIAASLSSLDNKIELNSQINKNLEQIAQAIFKHWFIEFEFPDENGEPYKSSGGEMIDSELGTIPKGWEIANFNAFVNETSNGDWGKASASDNYEKKVCCMRGTDIPEICEGRKGKMPIRYILEKNLNKKALCAGDLVIEISGGSPTQSTGRATYVIQEILNRYDAKLICSNFCKVIKLKNKDNCEYLFLYLRYLYELNIFFNFENGTTGIKNLDIKNLFEKYKIKVPDKRTIKKFRKIIRGVFRKIQENGYENNKLSSLRDALLPKLMSGEIRVPINSEVLISKNN